MRIAHGTPLEVRMVTTQPEAEAAHGLITQMCIESGYTDRPARQPFIDMLLNERDGVTVLMAWRGGRPVGTATLSKMLSVYKPGPCGVYRALYVPPEYRRDGIAEKLFAASRAETKRRGWQGLWWTVYDNNLPSLKFFEKAGNPPAGKGSMKEFWLPESEL